MSQEQAERWHCMNPACGRDVPVEPCTQPPANNPRCTCGAIMKKTYHPPVFRYLDFLQLEQPVFSDQAPLKD